jgi:hypothetical protein
MGAQGLQFQLVQVPFVMGLKTKQSPQAMQPSGLDIATDVEFDEWGALRTRKPYFALGTETVTGGFLTNLRRLAVNGNELLMFTSTGLYSWDTSAGGWVAKGNHYAAQVSEQTTFATTDDQIDQDQATLGNVTFFTWTGSPNASTTNVYIAAIDNNTGNVLLNPTVTSYIAANGASRAKLVALETKVLWFFVSAATLVAVALDPNNIATSAATTPTSISSFGVELPYYDATQQIGSDVAIGASHVTSASQYGVFSISSSLTLATANKTRTADGPVSVASDATGTNMMVVRGDGTAVIADLITIATLADTSVINKTLLTVASTPINQIAAVMTGGSTPTCYAFVSSNENAGNNSAFSTQIGSCTETGTIGTPAIAAGWCGVASRAFLYNNEPHVWLAFGQTCGVGQGSAMVSGTGAFENAYFLYGPADLLTGYAPQTGGNGAPGSQCLAKAVYESGAGLSPSIGRLPTVQVGAVNTTFTVCLSKRRQISVGTGNTTTGAALPVPSAYAMRSPQSVTFTFDSNQARQTERLGLTTYVAAGEVLQYDGAALYEVGFHIYPWYLDAIVSGSGSIATGTYGYKGTFRWYNAQGESERSTTATLANATNTGTAFAMQAGPACPITHKTANPPALEVWRTADNPTLQAPMYLITDQNPANSGASANPYIPAPATGFASAFTDGEADATATTHEANNENGGVLSNLAPPAATLIAADYYRIFLAGIAGYPDQVWYSLLREDGDVAAFNDALTIDVPPGAGPITAMQFLAETLIVFRQSAIFAFPGDGYDNTGGGTNYAPQLISTDVGAVGPDAIALGPFGLIFKTLKGWYTMDTGRNIQYVGEGVAEFDGETVVACHVVPGQNQVRAVTTNRILVYDYIVQEWSTWSVAGALHACIWQGQYVYLDPVNGPQVEESTLTPPLGYGIDVETGWIKLNDLQGRGYVRNIQVLGEYRGAHALQVRVAYNYQLDGSGNPLYLDNMTWTPSSTVVGGPEQVRHGPSQKRCQAIKVRLTALQPNGSPGPSAEACTLTGIALDVGIEPGLFSGLSPASRV